MSAPPPNGLPRVALSTTSVYPEDTEAGFELAATLGYDGIELMVGIDPVAADVEAVERLRDRYGVPVLSIHAPCLLVTQNTWGDNPWEKLHRSAAAAHRLGADVVVVHPPFRWQRDYARTFEVGIQRLNDSSGVTFAVENMYPWRTPAGDFKAYLPAWDPSHMDYSDLVLDLSHASTSRSTSLAFARAWGDRLKHVHLADGGGGLKDEHLLPGRGDQRAADVLNHLAGTGFSGHVVVEVNTRTSGSRAQRRVDLAGALAFTRAHLAQPVPSPA